MFLVAISEDIRVMAHISFAHTTNQLMLLMLRIIGAEETGNVKAR
jgi:hypothetical protein